MAEISKITVNDTTYDIKDEVARNITGVLSITENHNGIYRGKWLNSGSTAQERSQKITEVADAIKNGDFSDIYLGDHFAVQLSYTLPDGSAESNSVTLMVASIDSYYGTGDTPLYKHHVVLIPKTGRISPKNAYMNATNTTEGGYAGSYMHTTLLPCYETALRDALNDRLIPHRVLLTTGTNPSAASMGGVGRTGAANSSAWSSVYLSLMSEIHVYGTMIFSSSGYDAGSENQKFQVFNFVRPRGADFWLSSINDSSRFCRSGSLGQAAAATASNASAVNPYMLFG
jgi:hypothetical protein